MGEKIKTKKHQRHCPCPQKPPIPRTAGPLHWRPWTVSDFAHRRRQFLLKEPKPVAPDYNEYHGSKCTDITETQRQLVPLHPLHPNLINAPAPFHNRKVTSVTEYIAHMGKPKKGGVITTEEVPYHGNKATSITEYLRYVPPAHPAAKGGDDVALPFYGVKRTDATSWPKDPKLQRAEPTILSFMLPHRPKTAPTVVFPQHVSPAVLVNALAERRRRFLEKEQQPKMPNSARVPSKQAEVEPVARGCQTARSDTGVSYGQRPKTARTEPSTPRSDSAAPPTTRPKTANDATKSESLSNAKTSRPATTGTGSRSRADSITARSDRSCRGSTNCSHGSTPASVSTTPRSGSSRGKPSAGELLSRAAHRLGPEKLQRITNWTGYFDEPKPKMAWR